MAWVSEIVQEANTVVNGLFHQPGRPNSRLGCVNCCARPTSLISWIAMAGFGLFGLVSTAGDPEGERWTMTTPAPASWKMRCLG
jgi:hypothetical protein